MFIPDSTEVRDLPLSNCPTMLPRTRNEQNGGASVIHQVISATVDGDVVVWDESMLLAPPDENGDMRKQAVKIIKLHNSGGETHPHNLPRDWIQPVSNLRVLGLDAGLSGSRCGRD